MTPERIGAQARPEHSGSSTIVSLPDMTAAHPTHTTALHELVLHREQLPRDLAARAENELAIARHRVHEQVVLHLQDLEQGVLAQLQRHHLGAQVTQVALGRATRQRDEHQGEREEAGRAPRLLIRAGLAVLPIHAVATDSASCRRR